MDNAIRSESGRRKVELEKWHPTRIFVSRRKDHGPNNLDSLRIFYPKLYYENRESARNEVESEEREEPQILPINYKTTDKATLNYLRNHNLFIPYSINTVHLQDPYRVPQRLEGFALPENLKEMYRSKESTLRWRYKNGLIGEEAPEIKEHNHDDEKRTSTKNFQECLKNSEISTTVKQYCLNSSLHGLRYVGDSKLSIVERIFWIVSFIAAVLTAAYYIWFLYQKWKSSPIIISLSPEPVSLNEFPFPAVTICNMNNVKKSEAIQINEGNNTRKKLLLEDFCNTNNTVVTDSGEDAVEWNVIQHFMINVSQSCNDMLYTCKWKGNPTECEKIFNPTLTDEGICCNFNSVDRKHLFYNPRDWPDLNITYVFAGIDWNPEIGYDSHVPADAIPWRPYGAGLFYGLTLVLDADVREYYCSSTASIGFKMVLHNPVETPKMAAFGFAISPGKETRVIVTPRIATASKTILSIPQKKRKCFFTSERKLRYYRTYTQRNCILECEANFTQKLCHCVQYYMPKSSNTPICGRKDDQCATTARRTMEMKLYDDASPFNLTEIPSCNCWPGCFELNYNMEISQSSLLPSFNIAGRYIKKNPKYFVENMAVVHIYFVDSQFIKSVKNELFGFTEFLSSTGGLLGLFMGFSFLSFMEILYFLTLRVWCHIGEHKNSSKTVIQVHPLDRNNVYPFVQ